MSKLILSHWTSEMEVSVESKLIKDTKSHHILGVRFLYNFYRKKFKGSVLNYDEGMNFPLIIQIFLTAVFNHHDVKFPVLILSREDDVHLWHRYMKQTGANVSVLNERNCQEVFREGGEAGVILASLEDLKLMHPYRENKFEFVIVDQLDTVAYKMIFKRLSGNFNIGLTNKDFMEDRDQKLLWTMLNWCNPKLFGKLADFYQRDDDHLRNLRNPYDEVWHRLSWNSCEDFTKDTGDTTEANDDNVTDRSAVNDPKPGKESPQTKSRKRKLQKSPKRRDIKSTKKKDDSSSENQRDVIMDETQLTHDNNGVEAKENGKNYSRDHSGYHPRLTTYNSVSKSNGKQNGACNTFNKSHKFNEKCTKGTAKCFLETDNEKILEECNDRKITINLDNEKETVKDANNEELHVQTEFTDDLANTTTRTSPILKEVSECDDNTPESDILLSIMEGTFSQSLEGTTDDVTKSNGSKNILTSLFGDEAEYIDGAPPARIETELEKNNDIIGQMFDAESAADVSLVDNSNITNETTVLSTESLLNMFLDSDRNTASDRRKFRASDILESLFNFDEHENRVAKDKAEESASKLSETQRSTLISSLFGE